MQGLRAFFRHHRRCAALIVVLALALRALVPAGYMLGSTPGRTLTIEICADSLGQHITRQITVPQSASADPHQDAATKGDKHCPYGVLGHALLGGADPLLLAEALLFILAVGLARRPLALPAQPAFLRPPLRGPPLCPAS